MKKYIQTDSNNKIVGVISTSGDIPNIIEVLPETEIESGSTFNPDSSIIIDKKGIEKDISDKIITKKKNNAS